MAIAGYKPTINPIGSKPNLPIIESPSSKGIIYDDKNQPLHNLLAYVEGSPWSVTYYSQIVGDANDLRELDPTQTSVLQQYQEIKELEIRVGSQLNPSYDATTGITTVTGSATIYPFLIPNTLDYFISDAGDNRRGIFRVTNVERMTLSRDSVYTIDYEMVGYAEVDIALYDNLISKVIRSYHFSKDRLIEGLSPTLKTSDYNTLTNLKAIYKLIVKRYFRTFFNKRYSTLVLPGQKYAIYDSYLVDFLFKIVDTSDANELRYIKQLPTDQDLYLNQPQFWELLLDRDYTMIDEVNSEMSIANKTLFNNNSYIHELRYTNIQYIVYPTQVDNTMLIDGHVVKKSTLSTPDIIEITSHNGGLASLLTGSYVDVLSTIPLIKLVTVDTKYILSNDFYIGGTNLSLLEQLTRDYIKNHTLDLVKINVLANAYEHWGRLEQYYYGPILMLLMKQADRNTYV